MNEVRDAAVAALLKIEQTLPHLDGPTHLQATEIRNGLKLIARLASTEIIETGADLRAAMTRLEREEDGLVASMLFDARHGALWHQKRAERDAVVEARRKIEREAGLWAKESEESLLAREVQEARLAAYIKHEVEGDADIKQEAKPAADINAGRKETSEEFRRIVKQLGNPTKSLVGKATSKGKKGKA